MLLLALVLLADLSLFTADPEAVEAFEKKLDEGAPWVDEFGQPAGVEGDTTLGDSMELQYWQVKEDWAWSEKNYFTRAGERTLFVGVDGFTRHPWTPIDGRQFLFSKLPDRSSRATVVNPYERQADRGTVYVSHVLANIERDGSTDQQRIRRAEQRMRNAGFDGFGFDPPDRMDASLPGFHERGFPGLIIHAELAPEVGAGPFILVVTLPIAAPGFVGMSEDEAVRRWRAAVRGAREDSRVVAVLWGRFWDDPVTGIGPKTDDVRLVQGRAEAAGLWDVTGRPKLSLLERLNAETDPTDPE